MRLSDELSRPSQALTGPVVEEAAKRTKQRQMLVRVNRTVRRS